MSKFELIHLNMNIKVLGTGCAKCNALEQAVRQAAKELNIEASIEKVEAFQEIMAYGIMLTPGLVIDEKVVLSGKVPDLKDLKALITQHA